MQQKQAGKASDRAVVGEGGGEVYVLLPTDCACYYFCCCCCCITEANKAPSIMLMDEPAGCLRRVDCSHLCRSKAAAASPHFLYSRSAHSLHPSADPLPLEAHKLSSTNRFNGRHFIRIRAVKWRLSTVSCNNYVTCHKSIRLCP